MILQTNDRQVEKEGRTELRKFEYLENEKSFMKRDEIKKNFIVSEGLSFGEKMKI